MPNLQLPKHKEAKKALVKLKEKLNEKIKNDSGGDLKEYEMEMDEFMKANPLIYKKNQKLTEEDDKQLKIINTDRKVYWKDIPTTFAKRNATEYNDIISVAQKGRVRTDDERNQDSLNNPPKSKSKESLTPQQFEADYFDKGGITKAMKVPLKEVIAQKDPAQTQQEKKRGSS